MKLYITLITLFLLIMTLTGCTTTSTTSSLTKHKTIDGKKAKEMMDQDKKVIVLDVRTPQEYESGHIKNAILLPDYDLKEKASEFLANKSTPILIYCRSGRRSAQAAKTLSSLGYAFVYDFGGIIDWPYEVVKE